jgi:hypothetical protein
MTAIRNFPDAPLARRQASRFEWTLPSFAVATWTALQRYGRLRAARELARLADHRALGNPVLARQLRAAAAECRQAAHPRKTSTERSPS